MTAKNDPNLNLSYGYDLGEDGWNTGMDTNLKKLGAITHLSVISATTITPPTIVNGSRYIIPSGATGVWSGKAGQVAVAVEGSWEYYTPNANWIAHVEDDSDKRYRWSSSGSAWVDDTVDVSGFVQASDNTTFTGTNTFNNPITAGAPTNPTHVALQSTVTDAVDAINYVNLGGGEGVFEAISGDDVRFKSFVAGTGISLSSTGTELTLSATGGGGSYADLNANNTFTGLNNTFKNVLADQVLPSGAAVNKNLGVTGNRWLNLYVDDAYLTNTPDGTNAESVINVDYIDTEAQSVTGDWTFNGDLTQDLSTGKNFLVSSNPSGASDLLLKANPGATVRSFTFSSNTGTAEKTQIVGISADATTTSKVGFNNGSANLEMSITDDGTDLTATIVGDIVNITGNTSTTITNATVNGVTLDSAGGGTQYLADDGTYKTVSALEFASDTGTLVTYTGSTIYNSSGSPATGNITHNTTGGKTGVEITIYHNDVSEPSYPAEWTLVGSGNYTTGVLNIIVARFISSSRIEYVVTQEA